MHKENPIGSSQETLQKKAENRPNFRGIEKNIKTYNTKFSIYKKIIWTKIETQHHVLVHSDSE